MNQFLKVKIKKAMSYTLLLAFSCNSYTPTKKIQVFDRVYEFNMAFETFLKMTPQASFDDSNNNDTLYVHFEGDKIAGVENNKIAIGFANGRLFEINYYLYYCKQDDSDTILKYENLLSINEKYKTAVLDNFDSAIFVRSLPNDKNSIYEIQEYFDKRNNLKIKIKYPKKLSSVSQFFSIEILSL